jgi:hypothetical protein
MHIFRLEKKDGQKKKRAVAVRSATARKVKRLFHNRIAVTACLEPEVLGSSQPFGGEEK